MSYYGNVFLYPQPGAPGFYDCAPGQTISPAENGGWGKSIRQEMGHSLPSICRLWTNDYHIFLDQFRAERSQLASKGLKDRVGVFAVQKSNAFVSVVHQQPGDLPRAAFQSDHHRVNPGNVPHGAIPDYHR